MGNITELRKGNLDGLKKQVCECVDHAHAQGYKLGYTKGKNDGHAQGCNTQMKYDKTKIDETKQESYNEGYNAAINDYKTIVGFIHFCTLAFRVFLVESGFYDDLEKVPTNAEDILYDIICKWDLREIIDEFKKWQE